MRIETVDNHSVAMDLLTGGLVIDAGARGFRFSKYFAELGHFVLALDPAPGLVDPKIPRVTFMNSALIARSDRAIYFHGGEDPEAWHLSTKPSDYVPTFVLPETLPEDFDLLKLNVEGSEYSLLMHWPGPIARQIVVSFHEHTEARRGDEEIQKIVDHLAQWYTPVRHAKDQRYCAGMNFWDSLFVRKELL